MKLLNMLMNLLNVSKKAYFKFEGFLIMFFVMVCLVSVITACSGQGCNAEYIVTPTKIIPAFRGECVDNILYKNDRYSSKWLDDMGRDIICDDLITMSEKDARDVSTLYR